MATVKYTKDHEYIRVDGDTGTIGISHYAQEQLGDVVFVELPTAGKAVKKGDSAAVVESVKAASDIYSPVSGQVTEANPDLEAAPATVNDDPAGKGWFFKVKIANPAELDDLMDEAAYKAYLDTL
ncbi:MAG: glycine cleavage system H protein [Xanthobacteraceae bacterium]|nr:MAG: glycine cleavage system H protein [Xanthobacteraceae bacterium]